MTRFILVLLLLPVLGCAARIRQEKPRAGMMLLRNCRYQSEDVRAKVYILRCPIDQKKVGR